MIFEKIDLNIDIETLRNQFLKQVSIHPPVMQSSHFGGWSILSSNGSYTDGWAQGQKNFYNPEKPQVVENIPTQAFFKPTEICTGYILSIMKKVADLGLNPRRARISMLKAGGVSARHRDAADKDYAVRLHIPVITNPDSVFSTDEGEAHFPADGSGYIVRVNRPHQVFNRGQEDRIHIFMDILDNKGITKFHSLTAHQSLYT
jgi:hypothetical protein